jgi:hypothetical protein
MKFRAVEKVLPDNTRVFDVVTDGTPLDTTRKLEADLIALALNEVMTGFQGCGNVYQSKVLYGAIKSALSGAACYVPGLVVATPRA